MAQAKYTGQLYQLASNRSLHFGAYVKVNGPHDTYGKVLKSDPRPDGSFLNLIRGVPAMRDMVPAAQF